LETISSKIYMSNYSITSQHPIIEALIIFYGVSGFGSTYVWTRIYFSRMLELVTDEDDELKTDRETKHKKIDEIKTDKHPEAEKGLE